MTLLDPTYAKKYIPIIASVSEHQPTTWGVFYMDNQNLLLFMPVGLFFCFRKATFGSLFIALYGILAMYFSCVMIWLLLVLAPSVCVLAGIGISEIVNKMFESLKNGLSNDEKDEKEDGTSNVEETKTTKKKQKGNQNKNQEKSKSHKAQVPSLLALILIGIITYSTFTYVCHSVHVASEAYSSPSVVLAGWRPDGSKQIIDDFWESYDWLW